LRRFFARRTKKWFFRSTSLIEELVKNRNSNIEGLKIRSKPVGMSVWKYNVFRRKIARLVQLQTLKLRELCTWWEHIWLRLFVDNLFKYFIYMITSTTFTIKILLKSESKKVKKLQFSSCSSFSKKSTSSLKNSINIVYLSIIHYLTFLFAASRIIAVKILINNN
jgi:hypothetical protein